MKVTVIRSDAVYLKMMAATEPEKRNLYRELLMQPFEYKWKCIGVPLKADTEDGYDAIAASVRSGGYHPSQITFERAAEIEMLGKEDFWTACKKSVEDSLLDFENNGIKLKVQDYVMTVLLSDPRNPMTAMTGEYCGDGGIPGYITGTIVPNEKSMQMLPVAFAHETNHNVRWQFLQWGAGMTLADMLVSEGLAENFAAIRFGEDKVGKWVTETSEDTLQNVIKPCIREHLGELDFGRQFSYLYGDEIMALQGGTPVGMPYCAGYACGYAMIKYYLEKTGKSIYEATILPTEDIMKEMEGFWK